MTAKELAKAVQFKLEFALLMFASGRDKEMRQAFLDAFKLLEEAQK